MDKIKALWATIKADSAAIWEKDKFWFIPIFGAALIAKFRDVLIQLIIGAAKHTVEDTEKKNTELLNQENNANDAADALEKDAENKADEVNNTTVDEDWFKKK